MPDMPEASNANRGTVLAFDFGLKRIGVAVGELQLGLAHPLTTIQGEKSELRFDAISKLIAEWKPSLLVVGLPRHLDGSDHEFGARCRRFARQLEGRFHVPAVLVDERLTSAAAELALREGGIKRGRTKSVLDQAAAQQILQTYLDERHHAAA
jgi:putative Holliday junction resolvase